MLLMDTTTIHELEAGQALRLALRRGDRLWLRSGSLLAEPPAVWLGETLLRRQERWPEGRTWSAAEAGTWHCHALGRTTLVMQRRRRGAGLRAALRWLGWTRLAAFQRFSSTGSAATSSATPEAVSNSSTMRRNASSLMPM